MTKSVSWRRLIETLPPGLSIKQASAHLGQPYSKVRWWLRRFSYSYSDGRTLCWPTSRRRKISKFDPDKADWSLPNVAIARMHGISRERVRQIRDGLHLPKV